MELHTELELDAGPEAGLVVGETIPVELLDPLAADVSAPIKRAHTSSRTSRASACSSVSLDSGLPPGRLQSAPFQVTSTIRWSPLKQMPSAWLVSSSGGRNGGSNQAMR
jgi:hypothetical protein